MRLSCGQRRGRGMCSKLAVTLADALRDLFFEAPERAWNASGAAAIRSATHTSLAEVEERPRVGTSVF